MTKHASTSNCAGKDGGGGCGGVPSPLPSWPLPCLPLSLCTPLLPSLLPLLPLSPWLCPCAAAAINNNSSKHGNLPQPPPPSLLPSTWGGGHAHCGPPSLPPLAHCRRIIKEDWDHLGIGSGGSPPPHPHLPLPPEMMGSVAVDVYWHD
jgi:hypothetical protein